MSGPEPPGEPPFALTVDAAANGTLRCTGCGDCFVVVEDDRGNLVVGCSCPPDTAPRRTAAEDAAGGWPVKFRVAEDPMPPAGRGRGADPKTETRHEAYEVAPAPTAVERLRDEIHDRAEAARRDGRVVSAVVLDAERYGWLAADEARRRPTGGTGSAPDPGDAHGFEVKALETDEETMRLLFEDDSRTMSEHYTDDRPEEQDDG